jgi:hypothetical protein
MPLNLFLAGQNKIEHGHGSVQVCGEDFRRLCRLCRFCGLRGKYGNISGYSGTRQGFEALPGFDIPQLEGGQLRVIQIISPGEKQDYISSHRGSYRGSPALDAEFIEMTIPGKPRSSNQKYRLTEKGNHLPGIP